MVCNFCFSDSVYNKANIFLGLIEYELNSLLGASHLVDYISVHILFDLERYLLIMPLLTSCEVYVLNPIGNLTYDYEPLVRIGIRKLKEDFLLALIDI